MHFCTGAAAAIDFHRSRNWPERKTSLLRLSTANFSHPSRHWFIESRLNQLLQGKTVIKHLSPVHERLPARDSFEQRM